MTLDNEQQRGLLLEMFGQMQFPGKSIPLAYALMQAIESATVAPDPAKPLDMLPALSNA